MKSVFLIRAEGCIFALLMLTGCSGSSQPDIRQWVNEQKNQARPTVEPINGPKKFTPQAYVESDSYEPFDVKKLTQVLKRGADQYSNSELIAPELSRRKESLEYYPLDAMTMVGSLSRNGQQVALVRVEKLLYQVQLGSHMGLNYGRVTKITETELALREIVQDASGEWIERMATLQLQENSK